MLAVSASLQCLSSEEEQSGSIASGLAVGDGWLSQSCFNGFPDRGRKEAFAKRGRTKNVQRIWNKYLFMRIFYICVLFMLYLYLYIFIYVYHLEHHHGIKITIYIYIYVTRNLTTRVSEHLCLKDTWVSIAQGLEMFEFLAVATTGCQVDMIAIAKWDALRKAKAFGHLVISPQCC